MPPHIAAAIPVFLVMGFVSMLVCGIGVALGFGSRPPRGAQPVAGEVIGFSSYRHKGRTMYSPRYRAVLHDGRTVEGGSSSGMSKSWQSPPVGTRVALLYSPEDPKSPLSEAGLARYMSAILLFGVGAFVGAVGFAIAFGIAFG